MITIQTLRLMEEFKINQNKMKQTAVEWFADRIKHGGLVNKKQFYELLEQAKEMEEEQHQETFEQSRSVKIFEKDFPPVWESWEQYYNETFKSE